MKGQALTANIMIHGQRIAEMFKAFSGEGVINHNRQNSKIYSTSKTTTIERYQRDYEVEYAFVNNELQIWAIDGNQDVEDTYSEDFIKAIETKIEESIAAGEDSDEEYDEWFQNAQ